MTQTDDIKMVVTHDRQERQPITAPTKNWRFSASYDSFVVNQTFVLRMNICGENRQLLVAANRYSQPMNPKFNSLNQTNMRDNFNVDDILNKNRLDTQNYINKMVAFNKQLKF